jgi:acetoin utilization protein AcuA
MAKRKIIGSKSVIRDISNGMSNEDLALKYKLAPDVVDEFDTPEGRVTMCANCPPGFFRRLTIDSVPGNFGTYSSIIQRLEEFENIAAGKDGRVSLALLNEITIVGYLACWRPNAEERWSRLGALMYELGAIEVNRNFRNHGLARRLIKTVMSEPFIEDKIVYMNGYAWTWDVEDSGRMLSEYRDVHLKLLGPYNFREFYTNEPNIRLRDENIFMARIGARVSVEERKRFKRLLLGLMD